MCSTHTIECWQISSSAALPSPGAGSFVRVAVGPTVAGQVRACALTTTGALRCFWTGGFNRPGPFRDLTVGSNVVCAVFTKCERDRVLSHCFFML